MIGSVRRLVAISPPAYRRVVLTILLGALAVACGIGLMATAGWLIARASQRPEVLELTVAIVLVRAFGLTRPVARYLERLTGHDLAFRSLAGIRARFYRSIEPLAPAELDAYRSGDLLGRMLGDVDTLQNLFLRGLTPPAVALVAGGGAVLAAAIVLPSAGLVLALGLLLYALLVPLVGVRWGRRAQASAEARGELSAQLVQTFEAAPELVVYGLQDARLQELAAADARVSQLSRSEGWIAGLTEGLGVAITGVTVAAVVAESARAHAAGDVGAVWVAALALLALASFEAVAALPQAGRELSATVAAGERVLELVDRRPVVTDPADPVELAAAHPALRLERVTAGYGDEPAVLEGFDLDLEPGAWVGLVGPSGSGKTTVVNLLLRFLDPREGRVLLDGHDLRDLRQQDVRGMLAVAGQDSHLFASSVRENLRVAAPLADDDALWAALRRARADEFVAGLPEGIDTLVGDSGTGLSGGQRQRLLIARALLRDAPILVLDEPTAHLDGATARELMADVLANAEGKTVLLITHRSEGLDRMQRVETLGARGQPPFVHGQPCMVATNVTDAQKVADPVYAGRMFWLTRNRLPGSRSALICASRS